VKSDSIKIYDRIISICIEQSPRAAEIQKYYKLLTTLIITGFYLASCTTDQDSPDSPDAVLTNNSPKPSSEVFDTADIVPTDNPPTIVPTLVSPETETVEEVKTSVELPALDTLITSLDEAQLQEALAAINEQFVGGIEKEHNSYHFCG
jgi:hypothetical protein